MLTIYIKVSRRKNYLRELLTFFFEPDKLRTLPPEKTLQALQPFLQLRPRFRMNHCQQDRLPRSNESQYFLNTKFC